MKAGLQGPQCCILKYPVLKDWTFPGEGMKAQKKIYDSIHGFIHFNDWEAFLIDSFAFQRLHYIKQLGVAYLVYPGAVHTRFEHSLGVMGLATEIFDKLAKREPLFQTAEDLAYWRQILRLAALVHDVGHLPFSHAAEKALLKESGHEEWSLKVVKSSLLAPLWKELQSAFPSRDPIGSAIKLSLGEKKIKELGEGSLVFSDWERVLSEIITGDFFGCDRIDYLIRDAKYTGLSYGVFDYHQLIEMLVLLQDEKGRSVLGVEENGLESCEALLLARRFMFRRLYEYPTVKAYVFHLSRFMKRIYQMSDFQKDLDHYLFFTDNEVMTEINRAAKDSSHPGHEDALPLFLRQRRFQALPLTADISEKRLIALQEEKGIPPEKISWELSKERPEKMGLQFPVLLKTGKSVPGHTLSELIIPPGPCGWLFLSPELELQIK